jgi:hypothetical protein
MRPVAWMTCCVVFVVASACCRGADVPSLGAQKPNTWVKRSPLPGGPPSPRLGYESSWCYDPRLRRLIRWGAHDPGGGGPQLSETWTFDPRTGRWEFLRTNNNPPGNCCCRDNGYDPIRGHFVRFSYPAYGHGWMWDRARLMRADSVWVFHLPTRAWKNMRPGSEPALNVGKGVAWDPNAQVFWVYDTRMRAYDPYTNLWLRTGSTVGKRTYFAFALDPRRNRIVMFGDHYRGDDKTRVYDIATDRIIEMNPPTHPPGYRACPTMVYDSIHQVMICVTLAGKWDSKDPAHKKMETWVYELDKDTWTKMNPPSEPDYSGTRGRLMWFLPGFNLTVLEGRTRNEQQIWTYRYGPRPAPTARRLPPPTGLRVVTMANAATLSWRAAEADAVRGYHVYRGIGTLEPWKTKYERLTDRPVTKTTFRDDGLKRGRIAYYYVTSVNAAGESRPSRRVRTQPPLVEGLLASTLATGKVELRWRPSAAPDVVGYVLERAVVETIAAGQIKTSRGRYNDPRALRAVARRSALGPFTRLTPEPLTECVFVDNVDLSRPAHFEEKDRTWRDYIGGGKGPAAEPKTYEMSAPGCPFTVYAYRVRAVNRLGIEGGPSPYQMTIPNEVEGLYSREDGSAVKLKWLPSPHSRIRGYLVYRQDGRWANSKITRLTGEPIRERTFTDRTAAGKSRRYHVLAVDAIGQEGIPSHPAWGFRPWRTHYAPWLPVDGWHQ